MTDDQFTNWIREQGAGYHVPPSVPADAMWARIAGDVTDIVVTNAAAQAAPTTLVSRPATKRTSYSIGAAALVATLCIGITIGRWDAHLTAGSATIHNVVQDSPANTAVSAPARTQLNDMVTDIAPGARGTASAAQSVAQLGAQSNAQPRAQSRAQSRAQPRAPRVARPGVQRSLQAATPTAVATSSPASSVNNSTRYIDPGSVYTVTADRHIADAEALLTAFRTDTKAGRVDPQLAHWARDLLATTRVLYDAPATRDPLLKALLGDLELVLVQLSTYQSGRKADKGLATQALTQSAIIPRLRAIANL